jgi:predicted DNA-binding transcriptional regulator AlpA
VTAIQSSAPRKTRPKKLSQPLETLHVDGALLEPVTVVALTGLRQAAIREAVAEGRFPQPVRLSATCHRWRSADVRAWLANPVPKASAEQRGQQR